MYPSTGTVGSREQLLPPVVVSSCLHLKAFKSSMRVPQGSNCSQGAGLMATLASMGGAENGKLHGPRKLLRRTEGTGTGTGLAG